MRLEDQSELKELYENLVAVYQPINSQEVYAIERIALAQHSLRRAARLEAGLFTDSFNQTCRPFGNDYLSEHLETGIDIDPSQAHSFGIAGGLRHITEQANSFSLFLRYQAQAERNYQRALADFERLKSLRPELSPNEPISSTNSQENQKVAEAPPDALTLHQWNSDPEPSRNVPAPVPNFSAQPHNVEKRSRGTTEVQ